MNEGYGVGIYDLATDSIANCSCICPENMIGNDKFCTVPD